MCMWARVYVGARVCVRVCVCVCVCVRVSKDQSTIHEMPENVGFNPQIRASLCHFLTSLCY